jgi:glycosyltransferase involved in cell wall biosynthesis
MTGRVAYIADHIAHWNAGTERQMLLLGNGLAAAGWTVPLIVLRGSAAAFDGRWPGTVTAADVGSLASPRAWLRAISIARRLRRDGFPVAHLFFNDVAILMPFVLRLFGIRVVVARRDMGFWLTPNTLRVLRILRPAVSMVVANSRAVAQWVHDREGYPREKIGVFYNGLIVGEAGRAGQDADPVAGPVIGLVANIRPVKRVDVAIEAFALIADRHPSARLSIVGDGDPAELRALAARLGVAQRVEFAGRVADAGRHIAGFTIALLTSESEGFSNALMEYMQVGKPVICTDGGGNAELIEDGHCGYLCPVGDSAAIARRLDQLLADPAACRRMGQAARRRVTALCDPDLMLERHAVLYQRLSSAEHGRMRLTAEKT